MVLDVGLPSMRHRPSGDEVIVVRVEVVAAEPRLVGEAKGEGLVLEHVGPIGHCPTREAWQASVHMRTSSTVEIPPLQIQCPKIIVDPLRWARFLCSAQALTSPHPTHARILKRCKYPMEDLRGPCNIVICEDGDVCLDFWYGSSHLTSFVGLRYAENADTGGLHAFDHLPGTFEIHIDGDQQNFKRLCAEERLNGLPQLFSITVDGRDNNSDVLRSQRRNLWYRNGPNGPKGK